MDSNWNLRVAVHLALVYIEKALKAGRDSPIAESFLGRVQSLDSFFYSKGATEKHLARYYSGVGNIRTAKKTLKGELDWVFDNLHEEGAYYLGYLGNVLMACGDDENAMAAWSLIQSTDLNCHGRCARHWTNTDNIYVCRQCCGNTCLDARCLARVQEGTLTLDRCDSNHKFLHIPAWTIESADRIEAGKVLVGNRTLKINEWLEGIKRDWYKAVEEDDSSN